MGGCQAQSSPGWGERSKEWGGGFKQRGDPPSRSRRPPTGRGACAKRLRVPFISTEAALGLEERGAQGLDPVLSEPS